MKSKIMIPALLLMAASFSSCEDYLTVESPDQLTSSSFWRDRSDAEAGLAAAYSQLEYYIDTWEFAEVKWPVEAFREDVVTIGSDVPNYPNWMELYNFSYTNGNSQFSSYWSNNYRGLSFSNQVVQKVAEIPDDKIEASVRDQIVNEARFLRAYYHTKLLLNWEKIVVRDHFITNQADLSAPSPSAMQPGISSSKTLRLPRPSPSATTPTISAGHKGRGVCISRTGLPDPRLRGALPEK